ncbi:arsenical resistance operon transcriptional repressor ArsD [Geobacillus thermodenitrificans]|nr:arsenic metallochaperone ArsD family protein [Geobacillus thermodenitrificans]PJW20756.1 arsenical resistance operon transcriptional repressor ArsD [Geobacillus thermodenitrificans]QNU31342.1 arsenic metallochaperone ArsD family protein [Geobacillus sp. 47C-IIb]
MKKIRIFDLTMCCPTDICGPSVDPELTRIAFAV